MAESVSVCSPLYQSTAFGFSGGLSLASAASGTQVQPARASVTRDWCNTTAMPSFSDDCAGQCNAANIPLDVGVAGAQLHASATPPTCPPSVIMRPNMPPSTPSPTSDSSQLAVGADVAAASDRSHMALLLAIIALGVTVLVAVGEAYLLVLRYLGYERVRTGPLAARDSGSGPRVEPAFPREVPIGGGLKSSSL